MHGIYSKYECYTSNIFNERYYELLPTLGKNNHYWRIFNLVDDFIVEVRIGTVIYSALWFHNYYSSVVKQILELIFVLYQDLLEVHGHEYCCWKK